MDLANAPPTIPYTVGLCAASICTKQTNEEAMQVLNHEHPTGIGPWKVSEDDFADGSPNPSPCPDDPERRHILAVC